MPKRKYGVTPEQNDLPKNRRKRRNSSRFGSVEYDERENFVNANIIPSANESGQSDSDTSVDEYDNDYSV